MSDVKKEALKLFADEEEISFNSEVPYDPIDILDKKKLPHNINETTDYYLNKKLECISVIYHLFNQDPPIQGNEEGISSRVIIDIQDKIEELYAVCKDISPFKPEELRTLAAMGFEIPMCWIPEEWIDKQTNRLSEISKLSKYADRFKHSEPKGYSNAYLESLNIPKRYWRFFQRAKIGTCRITIERWLNRKLSEKPRTLDELLASFELDFPDHHWTEMSFNLHALVYGVRRSQSGLGVSYDYETKKYSISIGAQTNFAIWCCRNGFNGVVDPLKKGLKKYGGECYYGLKMPRWKKRNGDWVFVSYGETKSPSILKKELRDDSEWTRVRKHPVHDFKRDESGISEGNTEEL